MAADDPALIMLTPEDWHAIMGPEPAQVTRTAFDTGAWACRGIKVMVWYEGESHVLSRAAARADGWPA